MTDDILTAPARRIREARKDMNWRQRELAKRLGVCSQQMSLWECGLQPMADHKLALCRVLAIDPQELFTLYALADLERARRRETL